MSNILLTTMLCGLLPIVPAMADDDIDNSTVAIKQFERFLGKWYEIARFDHKFERGQESTTAYYTKNDDGTLVVENSGWKNGKRKYAIGKAKTTNTAGLLRVSFFGPFYSDYRVMMLAPDYSYALIGSSSDKYLWILSRTPTITNAVKEKILKEAEERGYNTERLIWVDQSRNINGKAKDRSAS